MQRAALVFVGFVAACVPPGQAWSPSGGTWSSQPAYQRQPDPSEPDETQLDPSQPEQTQPDETQPDDSQPDSTTFDNSRRQAAGRSSRSGDNCAQVCGRFDQCRLWGYDSCTSYCSAHTSDPAKNLSAARWSCPKLEAWMQQLGVGSSSGGNSRDAGNAGGVTCTAEASLGTTKGNYPTIYRTITAMGNGPNRGEASVKALKDCGALVGAAQNLAWLDGDQTEGGNCAISRCTQ